jgi:hypothetical protein
MRHDRRSWNGRSARRPAIAACPVPGASLWSRAAVGPMASTVPKRISGIGLKIYG